MSSPKQLMVNLMEISIRRYSHSDAGDVLDVFRDACARLKRSNGGVHPDSVIDRITSRPDDELAPSIIGKNREILVAEASGTGELVGMGALAPLWFTPLTRSIASKTHYIRQAYQRGRAGISVGSMMRKATIRLAKDMGHRKIFGFSLQESAGFHKRFGAVFYPGFDKPGIADSIKIRYYEIPLGPGIINGMHPEPYLIRFGKPVHGPFSKGWHPH